MRTIGRKFKGQRGRIEKIIASLWLTWALSAPIELFGSMPVIRVCQQSCVCFVSPNICFNLADLHKSTWLHFMPSISLQIWTKMVDRKCFFFNCVMSHILANIYYDDKSYLNV